MNRAFCALLAAALLCACRKAPELKVVQAAAVALGGADKVQAVKTLTIEGSGENGNLGQNLTPEAPLTIWKVTDFKRTLDLEKGRMRTTQVRTAQFPFALATEQKQSLSLDGNVAWNATGESNSSRLTERAAHDRQVELLHHPVAIIRAALHPASKVSNYRQQANLELVDVTTGTGQMVTLAVDAATHLPSSVASMTDQPNLGDVKIETSFREYQDVDGLKLPMRLTTKLDQWMQSDLRVSKYTINGGASDLAASAALKAELPAAPVPPIEVISEEVAPGIWWLAGTGNHHSVVFEFADHLTLFELPESEARAKAVIQRAHSLKFGKPLTEVIISHHHFDHSAGLRVAAAEGLTIIAQSGNIAFFKDLIARKHTIVPDQLAGRNTAQAPKFKAVDDELVLKDSAMEVDLYHVKENSHSDTLLMAWVPREHILVQADLYDSTWLKDPWADNLIKNVELRNLKVARDVPIHGKIESYADVLKRLTSRAHE
jgi:glyoxylase-like metal-dependent hydrolase (beta-lactamase superfamily II)